uniref:Putative secreted protein n=1 Tax=Anopheles darlingi TaxID=43151 RepID=A0A2M4DN27_ANODA
MVLFCLIFLFLFHKHIINPHLCYARSFVCCKCPSFACVHVSRITVMCLLCYIYLYVRISFIVEYVMFQPLYKIPPGRTIEYNVKYTLAPGV